MTDIFKETVIEYNKIKFPQDLKSRVSKAMRHLEEMLFGKGLPYIGKVSLVSFKEKDNYIKGTGTTIDTLLNNLENIYIVQSEGYVENKKYILEPHRVYYASDIFGEENVLVDSEVITTLDESIDITFEIRPSFSSKGTDHINNYSKYTVKRYTTPTLLFYSLYPHITILEKNIEERYIKIKYSKSVNVQVFINLLEKIFSTYSDSEVKNTLYRDTDYKVDNLIDSVELPNAKPAFKKIKQYYDSEFVKPPKDLNPQELQTYYYEMMFAAFIPSSDKSVESMRMKIEYDTDDIDEIELYDRIIKKVLTRIGVGDARIDAYSLRIREVLNLV